MQRSVVVAALSVLLLLGGAGPVLAAPAAPEAPPAPEPAVSAVSPSVAWWSGLGLLVLIGAAGTAPLRRSARRP